MLHGHGTIPCAWTYRDRSLEKDWRFPVELSKSGPDKSKRVIGSQRRRASMGMARLASDALRRISHEAPAAAAGHVYRYRLNAAVKNNQPQTRIQCTTNKSQPGEPSLSLLPGPPARRDSCMRSKARRCTRAGPPGGTPDRHLAAQLTTEWSR